MEGLRLVFLLCIINPVFQESIDNILGDPVEFSATKSCQKSGAKLMQRLKDDSPRPVAHWDDGWKPEPDYRHRMSPGDSVILKSTNINDNGLRELTCDPEEETLIQLYVVVPSKESVTEGETATLDFHHINVGGTVRYIRCERHGELVYEVDFFSGKITYGTKFEERVSVSSNWKMQGDFSPTLMQVQLEDQGDYIFYALDKDRKRMGENPVAVRMRVKTNPDQITSPLSRVERATEEKMGTGTIVAIIEAVMFLIAILATGFVWWLKSRGSSLSSGPGDGRPAATVEMGLLTERDPASHVSVKI